MSERYKVKDQDLPYFITFATESWVDVFTRQEYKDIVLDSLRHCQGAERINRICMVPDDQPHSLIVGRRGESKIEEIIRDFKKYTSVQICRAIESNPYESRRSRMLDIFREAAQESNKHVKFIQNSIRRQNEYPSVELFSNAVMEQKLAPQA